LLYFCRTWNFCFPNFHILCWEHSRPVKCYLKRAMQIVFGSYKMTWSHICSIPNLLFRVVIDNNGDLKVITLFLSSLTLNVYLLLLKQILLEILNHELYIKFWIAQNCYIVWNFNIIGYSLTFNTSFYFEVFLFLAMVSCFGISIPSSGQFFFNVCQQLENKIIKIN
jgi:hypothetical protein